jgi:hypothetical protein
MKISQKAQDTIRNILIEEPYLVWASDKPVGVLKTRQAAHVEYQNNLRYTALVNLELKKILKVISEELEEIERKRTEETKDA